MSKFWARSSDSDESSSSEEESDVEINAKVSKEFFEEDIDPSDPNSAWRLISYAQVFLEPPSKPSTDNGTEPKDYTRVVCFSDTHGKHREVVLPKGDVLIHGGDMTKTGETGSIRDLSSFFQESGFRDVICIAGNHDLTLHPDFYEEHHKEFHRAHKFVCDESRAALQHCHYLEDQTVTLANDLVIHGSPWSPEFFVWAFGLPRGPAIQQKWDLIPTETDILVTHGPPLGRGDDTPHNGRAGCYDLLETIQGRVKPRLHVFGHIHEGAGVTYDGHTLYVNASTLDIGYQASNLPIVVDVPHDKSLPAQVVKPTCSLTTIEFIQSIEDEDLAKLLRECDASKLPSGQDLISPEAHARICEILFLRRRQKEYHDMKQVLSSLYASSF